MRKSFHNMFFVVLLLFSSFGYGSDITGIQITPDRPMNNDSIIVKINGIAFGTEGLPSVNISNNNIEISIYEGPPPIGLGVMPSPFSVSSEIGRLDNGIYTILVNMISGSVVTDSMGIGFAVSNSTPVPVPAYYSAVLIMLVIGAGLWRLRLMNINRA